MSFWDRPVYFTRDKVIIHLPLVVCNLFEGRLYINLRLSIAQNEADLGGERIGAVLDSKVKHGTVVSGKIPFGYRINEEKRLEVVPQDAAIILDAFEHYRSTVSVRATAAYIRQTYGLNWDNVRCHLNLCQTLYIGHYESNGRVNPNFCPPIVPRDLYDDVQKLLSNNTKANPTGRVFLFTSLLICAECGHRLAGIKNGHYCYCRCRTYTERKTSFTVFSGAAASGAFCSFTGAGEPPASGCAGSLSGPSAPVRFFDFSSAICNTSFLVFWHEKRA